jgi:hypothetical protein
LIPDELVKQERRAAKALLLADCATAASHEIIAAGGAMIVATGTCAVAQGGYWVVGDRANGECEIVASNPVINAHVGGKIWFRTGPHKSSDDAKLACSTIPQCPIVPEPPAGAPDEEKQ